MVDARLKNYFEDACDMLDSLDIEYGPIRNVTVNTRAKSRWGQCRHNITTDCYDIEISSMLLNTSYRAIMDTVLHELLHAHKDRFCHTGEWKKCAELVNDCYMYNIKRTTSAAEKNIDMSAIKQYKYKITCTTCGNTNLYIRKSKIVKMILADPHGSCRCGKCNGTDFIVKEN